MNKEEKFRRKLIEQYEVVVTPCYPNAYKVQGKNWPHAAGSNSTSNFFPTHELAQKEVDKRNNP